MRKPLFSLGLVVLVVGACSSSAGPTGTYAPAPPAHHYPTAAPAVPASTPYDTTTFTDPGVNPPVDPTTDRFSTFGLDVDTASYTIARRFIADGNLPDPASVRVEEYVNYFDQEWRSPDEGVFAIYADGGPSPFLAPDETLVRIGLKARDETDRSRPGSNLTFVIDVSGSMAREDRLELVKRSLRLLVDGLRPDDRVAIVVFGTDARVLLESKSA
jgi:Ca-activated chloride channel family protein